jgi:hypothetical protein
MNEQILGISKNKTNFNLLSDKIRRKKENID